MPSSNWPSADVAPSAHRSLLLDRARSVSAELHSLFEARRQNLAAIAHSLAVLKREELFSLLGYASVFAYAWDQHRMGKSKASELIAISNASDRLPRMRAAFDAGQLDWTKAREIAKVATPDTELEWLSRARTSTADDLRAQRKGEPAPLRRVLSLPDEAAALFDQLVAGVKQELGIVPDWEAVLELMKRGASGERGEAPVQRVVITECGTCQEATRETRDGPVPVSRAAVDHARCDGEIHDLRQEANRVKRTIPSRVRRRVLDRDRRRCAVPGCRAMAALDVHHEDGWQAGHDPARMVTLCWSHHRARHEGRLRIEGSAPAFRFSLLDGTVLGESRSAAGFSHENAGRETRAHDLGTRPELDVNDHAVRDATLALRSLGMQAAEAKRHVQAALAGGGERPWTAGELVRSALQAR